MKSANTNITRRGEKETSKNRYNDNKKHQPKKHPQARIGKEKMNHLSSSTSSLAPPPPKHSELGVGDSDAGEFPPSPPPSGAKLFGETSPPGLFWPMGSPRELIDVLDMASVTPDTLL
jgi:hypothetical protein